MISIGARLTPTLNTLGRDLRGRITPAALAVVVNRSYAEPVTRAAGQPVGGVAGFGAYTGMGPTGGCHRIGALIDHVTLCPSDHVPTEIDFAVMIAGRGRHGLRLTRWIGCRGCRRAHIHAGAKN